MTRMSRAKARTELLHEMDSLRDQIRKRWLRECLPKDWHGMETWHPMGRHKTRVTLRLDSDMVKWFRNTGPGYQKRVNMILRVYWIALMSGEIGLFVGEDTSPQLELYLRDLRREEEREEAERQQSAY
jgi:uncharacterized protein (DUF4415 family)